MRNLIVLAAFLALAACSSETETPTPTPGPPPVEVIHGPTNDALLTPYPSDRYTVADATRKTGLHVDLANSGNTDVFITGFPSVVEQLDAMDGFSTFGGVIVSFTAPIDIRGIVTDELADPPITDPARDANEYTKEGSPFFLIDVDPKSPERGKLYGVVPRYWAQAKDDYFPADDYTLVAMPATPLLPGTRYLFVVTDALKGADGRSVARSTTSDELLSGRSTGPYADEVIAALDDLEKSAPVTRKQVVLATAFTTATVIDETLAVAKRARAAPAPAVVSEWEIERPSTESDPRARFKVAFDTPEYRKPLPDGKWTIDGGLPVAQSKVGMEAFLAFSDATKSGPRPVVIFAHGLGGTKDGCWGTADRLKELNAAVFAIDSPEHGSRAADPDQNPIVASFSFFGVDSATQSFDIGRARDNFRQMASDQLELVRLIGSLGDLDLLPEGAPDGVPDLDVSRILYIGHSFGSVQGATIFALAPEIKHAVWNVGGDGLMMLLRDSGTFALLVNALKPPNTPDAALGRFFAMTQAIVDPGDPINYARFGALAAPPDVPGWAPRDMLIQAVIDDSIVPNSTSDALARAAGMTLVDPVRPISGLPTAPAPLGGNVDGATSVIAQFDKIEGDKLAVHGELIFSPEARAQYVEFFMTGLAKGHATVAPPYP